MKQSKRFGLITGVALISVAILLVAVSLGLSRTASATALEDTTTKYPTDYPAQKQTLEAEVEQTRDALLTVSTTPIFLLPPPAQPPEIHLPVGTPAGDGLITTDFLPRFRGTTNAWYQTTDYGFLFVYAGGSIVTPLRPESTGFIVVAQEYTNGGQSDYATYILSFPPGPYSIEDAVGDRLIIQTSNNEVLYFDVPRQAYVTSLTEVIPTVTQSSSNTPELTSTPIYDDDAPDDPWLVDRTSPANTDVNYKIDSSNDVDWFRFHVDASGTVQITLYNLPANYELYVYGASDSKLRGSSENEGTEAEQVIILDAVVDDYYVQVVGADGEVFSDKPYTLRFDAPVAITETSTSTTYPTDYPAQKQTEEVSAKQTDDAYAMTPASLSDGGLFPLSSTQGNYIVEPEGSPAGNGIIVSSQFGWPIGISPQSFYLENAWYSTEGDAITIVYAGAAPDLSQRDLSQGMIIVERTSLDFIDSQVYLTVNKDGPLAIIGAEGSRLIILAGESKTLYFDVPSEKFVDSLTESVATVTPVPTETRP